MAGHFSLFKLSCTTYLRSITTADQMRVISLHLRSPISASRYLHPHRFRPSPFHSIAFNRHDCVAYVFLHRFAYSATMSLHRIGCDHVTSSYRLRPRHFIVLAAGTSLHCIGCDHVTSLHRLRPRHFIASAATTSLHRIGCDHVTSSYRLWARHFIASATTTSLHRIGCGHVITAPPASFFSPSSQHHTFHSCRVYVFHFNIASPASAISARHHNFRICHDFV